VSKADRAFQRRQNAKQKPPEKKSSGETAGGATSSVGGYAPSFVSIDDIEISIKSGKIDVSDFDAFADYMRRAEEHLTGRIRAEPSIGFRDYPHRRFSEEYEQRAYAEQKIEEEGDFEARHHVPPDQRFAKLVDRIGPLPTLKLLRHILEEMGDLESIMDVLETEAEWIDKARRRSESYVDPRRWPTD
jgi:hypothetical protein